MYSVVLMMAMTTGGDAADLGRHHSSCCGETASHCGGRHHRGGCGGESSGCGTCGASYGGCATCGASYGGCGTCGASYGGCATCGIDGCSVTVADPTTAIVVVSLPADAKLTINDQATTSTSDYRVFVSPSLPTGQDFYYTLKAEITVDGKPTVVSKVVTIRAGEKSQVTLDAPTGVAER